jgi:hypothetical protein
MVWFLNTSPLPGKCTYQDPQTLIPWCQQVSWDDTCICQWKIQVTWFPHVSHTVLRQGVKDYSRGRLPFRKRKGSKMAVTDTARLLLPGLAAGHSSELGFNSGVQGQLPSTIFPCCFPLPHCIFHFVHWNIFLFSWKVAIFTGRYFITLLCIVDNVRENGLFFSIQHHLCHFCSEVPFL